jgi:hypothetical protein
MDKSWQTYPPWVVLRVEKMKVTVKTLPAALLSLVFPLAAMGFDPVPPTFPLQQGWLGADSAYSVPLGANNRSVWLFGDTYVRADATPSRVGANMIANTISIRTSDGTSQTIDYYWRNQGTSTPDAFFSSGTNAWRYWPEDGFTYNGKLYVCLMRIQSTGAGAFGFQEIGVDLAAVSRPQDSPTNWQISYTTLSTSRSIFPGISTVVDRDYVYLFADEDDNAHKSNRPIYLARIPLAMLEAAPASHLEYLADGNIWKPGPIGHDAKKIMDRGVTEMTVRWHPNLNRWVDVQISNEFPAHHIWRRQAPNLAGPWSAPVSIYTIPEYSPSNPGYGPDRFFYAGKEHIEFLNPISGKGIVTYVGNSMSASDVEHDLNLYVPEAVPLTIDPNPALPQ